MRRASTNGTGEDIQGSPQVLNAADRLRSAMQGSVVLPGDDAYGRVREISNCAVKHQPALFAMCETVQDVQAAVDTAREYNLRLSVRGGGHDWVGRALRDGGLVIDLSRMRRVEVDTTARVATVEGGATAGDLIGTTEAHGLIAATGMAGVVGMAGLTLGGGYGPLTPRCGLALDNLLGAEVVLADGRLVTANASENPDLFWALRGGGGNFGVVTSMRVRLHAIDKPLYGPIVFPWSQAESVLHGFNEVMASAPDELAMTAGVSFGPDGKPVISLVPTWSGEPALGEQIVAEIQKLGTPLVAKVEPTPYAETLRRGDELFANVRRYALRTRWQAAITARSIAEIIAAANECPSTLSMITLQSFHGAAARVPLDSTAFGLRQQHFMVLIVAAWKQDDDGRKTAEWARSLTKALAPDSLPGGYANLLGPRDHEQILSAYGSNAARLQEIKQRLDPEGMFLSAIPLPQ